MAESGQSISLHQAAREGNQDALEVLITRIKSHAADNADRSSLHSVRTNTSTNSLYFLDEADVDSFTPLHYAARYNREGAVAVLLKHRASPTVRNDEGVAPIHLAAKYGHTKILAAIFLYMKSEEAILAAVTAADNFGLTPLHYASTRGHLECVQRLLSVNPDADPRDEAQMTPLHLACSYAHDSDGNHAEVAKTLINYNADVRAQDMSGGTPLHFACMEGNDEVVKVLLKAAEQAEQSIVLEMLEDDDEEGNTALHLAVQNGHVKTVETLIDSGADVHQKTNLQFTALHIAARNGHSAVVELLVRKGLNTVLRDHAGMTALHRAAQFGRTIVIQFLLGVPQTKIACIEAKSKQGFSPLTYAAWQGHPKAVIALLQAGARVNVEDKLGKTCLHWAVEGNHFETVKILLGLGEGNLIEKAKVQALLTATDRYDSTALHVACDTGNARMVSMLVDSGADVNDRDDSEMTCLHRAVIGHHADVVKMLLQRHSALIKAEDDGAKTALHVAAGLGFRRLTGILIDAGAMIDSKDDYHATPLIEAAKNGHLDCVKELAYNDALLTVTDKGGLNALHHAALNGNENVVAFLIEYGAALRVQCKKGLTALDYAAIGEHLECAQAILSVQRWQEALKARVKRKHLTPESEYSELGMTPMKRLIKHLPEAALIVLKKSINVHKSGSMNHSSSSLDLTSAGDTVVEYDWQWITDDPAVADPGPSALSLMSQYKRGRLLAHPVVDAVLEFKWEKFARYSFFITLSYYITYVVFVTVFVIQNDVLESQQEGYSLPVLSSIAQIGLVVETFVSMLFEFFELVRAPQHYLGLQNALNWALYISVLMFLFPLGDQVSYRQWQAGALAVFLAWMNLTVFVRRYGSFGIYILMLTDTLKTVGKVLTVFSLFIVAFGLAFHILLQDQAEFNTALEAIVKTFIMMTGEYDFDTIFLGGEDPGCSAINPCRVGPFPFSGLVEVMFVLFVVLMNIVLMNLLIGLAIGDINSVSQSAELERQDLRAKYIMFAEGVLLKRFIPYRKSLTVTRHQSGGIFRDVLEAFQEDHTDTNLEDTEDMTDVLADTSRLRKESRRLDVTLRDLMRLSEKQSTVLRQIAAKHQIDVDSLEIGRVI